MISRKVQDTLVSAIEDAKKSRAEALDTRRSKHFSELDAEQQLAETSHYLLGLMDAYRILEAAGEVRGTWNDGEAES